MKLRYWIFTSGEEGTSGRDWGVKFTSPGLTEAYALDKKYRDMLESFSLTSSLERPQENTVGLLLLPWTSSEVVVGYIVPYTDAFRRPNISLVAVIVPDAARESFSSLPELIESIWRQNPVEEISRREAERQSIKERPDHLSITRKQGGQIVKGNSVFTVPRSLVWPENSTGTLVINGKTKRLFRQSPVAAHFHGIQQKSEEISKLSRFSLCVIVGVSFAFFVSMLGGGYWYYKISKNPLDHSVVSSDISSGDQEVITEERPSRAQRLLDQIVSERGDSGLSGFAGMASFGEWNDGMLKGLQAASANFPFKEDTRLSLDDVAYFDKESFESKIMSLLEKTAADAQVVFYDKPQGSLGAIDRFDFPVRGRFEEVKTNIDLILKQSFLDSESVFQQTKKREDIERELENWLGFNEGKLRYLAFAFALSNDENIYDVYVAYLRDEKQGVFDTAPQKRKFVRGNRLRFEDFEYVQQQYEKILYQSGNLPNIREDDDGYAIFFKFLTPVDLRGDDALNPARALIGKFSQQLADALVEKFKKE